MLRSLLIPLALALTTISLSACGDDDVSTPITAPPVTVDPTLPSADLELDGREFLSTSVEGHQLVEGTVVRIGFADGTLSINAGCNTIFGGYTIDGTTLRADALGQTDMACDTDLMAQDRWLTDVISLSPTLALDGDTLTITGVAGATIELLDRTVADPDRPLVGTRWVADGMRLQDAVSTLPEDVTVSITFESNTDGDRALVEAGCNRGSAEVTITDDAITFGPLGLTKMMCEADAMEVEAFVVALLDGEVSYRIDAANLTLDSADTATSGDEMGGTGMTFVAED